MGVCVLTVCVRMRLCVLTVCVLCRWQWFWKNCWSMLKCFELMNLRENWKEVDEGGVFGRQVAVSCIIHLIYRCLHLTV